MPDSAGHDEAVASSGSPPGVFLGRRVIVGVTGGIAAFKTAAVVSRLVQDGADVTVLMTRAATRFVSPLTFQALSGRPVYTNLWHHVEAHDPQHIALASEAHAVLVAPCSADCLARLATGRCNDIVSLVLCAVDRARVPVLLAPSMNAVMWSQPAVQRNLRTLIEDGYRIVGPAEGWQACRTVGLGRMSEPDDLLQALAQALGAVPVR